MNTVRDSLSSDILVVVQRSTNRLVQTLFPEDMEEKKASTSGYFPLYLFSIFKAVYLKKKKKKL